MCGIFGLITTTKSTLKSANVQTLVQNIFLLSESRGKEASGIAALHDGALEILKQPLPARKLIKTKEYKTLIRKINSSPLCLIGHSRLVTNGTHQVSGNNQPIENSGTVGVHNGIIVNAEKLWGEHKDLIKNSDLDSEIWFALLNKYLKSGDSSSIAINKVSEQIEGSFSIASLSSKYNHLSLTTNTGSLYVYRDIKNKFLAFASEKYILTKALKAYSKSSDNIKQLHANTNMFIDINNLTVSKEHIKKHTVRKNTATAKKIVLAEGNQNILSNLTRCKKCVLPDTVPFIRFNDKGICNYCINYQPIKLRGLNTLNARLKPHRKVNQPDCIIAFSGGRDSSYGLHFLKTELRLNPIAYTYDWGMVTDIARRNQARLCAKLGVEHIIISADIEKKRKHIRQNIKAWLKEPNLGMVPLFMAGDKPYLNCPKLLAKQTNTQLVFFCRNHLERTQFKTGFCGVNQADKWYHEISFFDKIKISAFYLRHYLGNPSYFNSSLLDTLAGFYHSFFVDRSNYIQLYDYISWDETLIEKTLLDEYNWEFSNEAESSWRIGDGTAAFYNYIYYTVAGFSEIDIFRSTQVRENIMSRETALTLVERENEPRFESIQAYARIIGFDFKKAITVINNIPKLY